jgi:hypothetical protein
VPCGVVGVAIDMTAPHILDDVACSIMGEGAARLASRYSLKLPL